jgi:phage regulator Rha-like protein
MSDFIVSTHSDNVLVIDSRLIAQELGIEHPSFVETIRKYQKQAESAFGTIRFETGSSQMPDGRINPKPQQYYLLTEEQATFYMTLSRNTPEVVELKIKLVKAFSDAKRLLSNLGVAQQQTTTVYIQRLQNMSDHNIADDVWATFREGAEILLLVEKDYRVPVSQLDLCDGSIGHHWSQYREEIGIDKLKNIDGSYVEDENGKHIKTKKSYIHRHRNQRGNLPANAFDLSELPIFKKWLREMYVPTHLPKYLVDKYGKRAVRQIYEEQRKLTDYILEITEEKRSAPKEEEKYQIFLAARDAISNRKFLG